MTDPLPGSADADAAPGQGNVLDEMRRLLRPIAASPDAPTPAGTDIFDILRSANPEPTPAPAAPAPPMRYPVPLDGGAERYAARALAEERDRVASAPEGTRNDALNRASFSLGQLVAGGALDEVRVVEELTAAAIAAGLTPAETRATIRSGISAGKQQPRAIPEGAQGPMPGDLPAGIGHGRADTPDTTGTPATVANSGAAGSATAPPRDSAAKQLVELALRRYSLGTSDDGPFAVPIDGPKIVRQLRGSDSLRAALAADFHRETGRIAPQQALAEALLTLDGRAQALPPERLHLRVAERDGTHYLDLGDRTGRAVEVTARGWQVIDTPPVHFRRTALTGALPEPQRGGHLDELWSLLPVTVADRPLILTYLLAALLRPDTPHPICVVRGEQGSGKTGGTVTIAGLLDPSPAQTRKPPRDVESWVTAAAGSWIVAVDNVSTIPGWWSDALCRAVTGDGDVRRRLYSDGDLTVFAFRRVVLLNGIDLGALRDDLAERLLTIELQRIDSRDRRLDSDLTRLRAEAHPRILGGLLDLAVRVLGEMPNVELRELPRMADFARLLAAVDAVLGTAGLPRYLRQGDSLAADAVDSDPVLSALVRTITEPWTGTVADLLRAISADMPHPAPPSWPRKARDLTGLLRRRCPSLRRLGWEVEDLGRGGRDKALRFRLSPPQTAAADAGNDAGMRASTPAERATLAPDARVPAGLWPAETASQHGCAGNAGIPSPLALAASRNRGEEGHRALDVPGPMPATPATPASDIDCTCGWDLLPGAHHPGCALDGEAS